MPVKGESKVINTILNRRSVREFTDKPVSKEDIKAGLVFITSEELIALAHP